MDTMDTINDRVIDDVRATLASRSSASRSRRRATARREASWPSALLGA
jgi:hypothetical protein